MLILLDLFEAGEEGFWNLAFAGWRQRGPVRSISRGSISVSQPFLRVAAPCSPVVAGLGLRHRRYEKVPRELRARPDSRESTKSIQLVRQGE